MLFCILSRLGSIRRDLACYSISYPALAVSAEGTASKNPSFESSSRKKNSGLQKPKLEKPKRLTTWKAQVEQIEACSLMQACWCERYLVDILPYVHMSFLCEEDLGSCRCRRGKKILDWTAVLHLQSFLPKNTRCVCWRVARRHLPRP